MALSGVSLAFDFFLSIYYDFLILNFFKLVYVEKFLILFSIRYGTMRLVTMKGHSKVTQMLCKMLPLITQEN